MKTSMDLGLLSLVALVSTGVAVACTAEVSGEPSGGGDAADTSAIANVGNGGTGDTSTSSGGAGGGDPCTCPTGEQCSNGTCEPANSTNTTSGNNATSAGSTTGASSTTGGTSNGVEVDGTCYSLCADASSDPDGDDWGWENEESCVVADTGTQEAGSPCDAGGSQGTSTSTTGSTTGSGTTGSGAAGTGGTNGSGSISGAGGTDSGGDYDCAYPGGGSCPSNVSCPANMPCGCQIVNGLGANKCALLNAGASPYMLASAMMETDAMDTNYAYGDNKTGDSFNAGVCKQNWGMMRQCHAPWQGLGQQDYATSDAMNSDPALDVQVYDECRAFFGDNWWAGHRNGAAGLINPNTQDIQNFKTAMDWTFEQLPGHESDNVRFWVSVPAIIYLEGLQPLDEE